MGRQYKEGRREGEGEKGEVERERLTRVGMIKRVGEGFGGGGVSARQLAKTFSTSFNTVNQTVLPPPTPPALTSPSNDLPTPPALTPQPHQH